jgi:uncharacterized lipoprotein YmbA
MNSFARFSVLGLLSSVLWGLAACNLPQPQADPVRHFTLSGPAAGATTGATVRPVQVAGHLRGRPMAIRVASNEIIYQEEVRWAESLDDALTQSLRARIGAAGAGSIVTVQIQRCELVRFEGNSVQLAATYSITAADGTVRHGSFTASPRTWDGKDYGVLVGQIREAVNELGDALAAALGK